MVIFAVMGTWKRGRELLIEQIRSDDPDLLSFIASPTEDETAHRAAHTAVFAVANPGAVPQASRKAGSVAEFFRLPRSVWLNLAPGAQI